MELFGKLLAFAIVSGKVVFKLILIWVPILALYIAFGGYEGNRMVDGLQAVVLLLASIQFTLLTKGSK